MAAAVAEPFEVLAEDVVGDPVAMVLNRRADVVVLDAEGVLRHYALSESGRVEQVLPPLDGVPVGTPALISSGPGRRDLIVRDAAGGLWHGRLDNGWRWAARLVAGACPADSDPIAVSWGPGRLDVFVRTAANTVNHYWYEDDVGFQGPEDCGGPVTGRPSAAVTSRSAIHVFARDGEGRLRYQYAWPQLRGHEWTTTTWQPDRGEFLVSPPAAAPLTGDPVAVRCRGYGTVENRLPVYASSGDELVRLEPWHWFTAGGPRDTVVGAGLAGGAAAVSVRPCRVDAFAPLANGALGHLIERFGPEGAATARWATIEVDTSCAGRIAVAGSPDRVDVFFRDGDGRLRHRSCRPAEDGDDAS